MAAKGLLNVRDTARLLGVHENTVRNWERNGVLRAVRLPGSGYHRFALGDIERMRDEMWRELAPATEGPAIRRTRRRTGHVISGDALK
jgi:excisionase family DNA binding protein